MTARSASCVSLALFEAVSVAATSGVQAVLFLARCSQAAIRCGRVFSDLRNAASALAICRLRSRSQFAPAERSASRKLLPLVSASKRFLPLLLFQNRRFGRLLGDLCQARRQLLVLLRKLPQFGQGLFDLLCRRRAIEDAKENLADQFRVVLLGRDEFG